MERGAPLVTSQKKADKKHYSEIKIRIVSSPIKVIRLRSKLVRPTLAVDDHMSPLKITTAFISIQNIPKKTLFSFFPVSN